MTRMSSLPVWFSSLVANTALLAADSASSPPADILVTPMLGTTLLALVAVIGLILGLAWLVRRTTQGNFMPDGLRSVASLALGTKERIVVVAIGDEQLLLGITANSIHMLHKLPQPLIENAQRKSFYSLLSKNLKPPEAPQ